MFTANWAILTSITLRDDTQNHIGRILQQTKCLVFCEIAMFNSDEHYPDEIHLPFLKTLIIFEGTRRVYPPDAHSILNSITAPILEILDTQTAFFDLSLSDFLKRSPRIWKLTLLHFDKDKSLTETMDILRQCYSLSVLSLYSHRNCFGTYNADQFLRAFVEEANGGVICPRLQDFQCSGRFDFSAETLRIFLERKQGDIDKLNISQWKSVVMNIRGIKPEKRSQEIMDLVSQKKAEGLNIRVFS